MTGKPSSDAAATVSPNGLRLEVSLEICRRYALPWLNEFNFNLDRMTAAQALAVINLRALVLAAQDEIYSQPDLQSQKNKLNDWMFSLSHGFQGQAHSDCVPAIVSSVETFRVPRAFLFEGISSLESMFFRQAMETLEDLRRFCYRRTASFTMAVGQILGAGTADHRGFFIRLGIGAGMLDVLLNWSFWDKQKWSPVPQEFLTATGSPSTGFPSTGRWLSGVTDLFANRAKESAQRQAAISRDASIIRRIATQGIEELAQTGPVPPSVDPPAEENLHQWIASSIDHLQTIHANPELIFTS